MAAALLLLLLACGPLDRLQELNRKGRVLATGVAIIDQGDYLAFEAYHNLKKLPGYQLESRTTLRDNNGALSTITTILQHDAQGNSYSVTQSPNGDRIETYIVDGRAYVYESTYKGWVETTPDSMPSGSPATSLTHPIRLISQLGAVPTKAGQETLQGRAATRYNLEYITAELAKTLGKGQSAGAVELHGTLWVDDQTGALLKSEILFYENNARQPSQEYLLETSQIGNIPPIAAPSPLVNPAAVVDATATAQAWSVLQVKLDHQGSIISFEVIPVEIGQHNSSAGMRLILRQLPANLLSEADAQAFLTRFGQQLKLSIPQQNLVTASAGFEAQSLSPQTQSIEVIYFFEVDLKELDHVELVLSSPGNPLFAAVPVANKD